MQKFYVSFEYEINGKIYSFHCEPNSPLVDAKEAIFKLLKDFGAIEDAHKAQDLPIMPIADLPAQDKVD